MAASPILGDDSGKGVSKSAHEPSSPDDDKPPLTIFQVYPCIPRVDRVRTFATPRQAVAMNARQMLIATRRWPL